MIDTIEQLKEERPDLVELFESMSKEDLLKQCYLECIDAINMEERVSLFMSECTLNMSKTNYELSALQTMINQKKEHEINEFCYYEICDGQLDEEILKAIKERASEIEI
ncbi:hypothetical protein [Chryseobacterium sp.]|uniref:hypothetical protein n=1 Tax=Chryseobacterium sp. TaxID=1871047 RepID=UPI0024E1ED67|nr:hypothetical protein [Chryseobacterium sp.]